MVRKIDDTDPNTTKPYFRVYPRSAQRMATGEEVLNGLRARFETISDFDFNNENTISALDIFEMKAEFGKNFSKQLEHFQISSEKISK